MKELRVDPVIENVQAVTEFVTAHLADRGCSEKTIRTVSVVIDEIFGNIVKHGVCTDDSPVIVRMEFENDPSALILTFIDHNIPFDPLGRADPNTSLPAKMRRIGGLGIFMVKKSVDHIDYKNKNGKNILKIKKYL